MTIEDIEIIVQANVKNAMKDIKKACKDAENQISSVQKAVDKVDTKNIQDSFSKTTDDIKKDVDDVRVYIHNLFSGLDTKEIDQIKDKFKGAITETDGQIGVLMSSLSEVEKYIEEIFNNKKEIEIDDSSIEETKESLKEIQSIQPTSTTSSTGGEKSSPKIQLPDTEALKNVEPTNLVNSWKTAIAGILIEIPKLSEVYDKTINSINASGIVDKFAGVKEQISSKLSGVKVAIDESKPVSAIKNIGAKISDLKGKFSNIKNYASIPFDYMKEKASSAVSSVKEKIKGIGDKFSKPINAIKKFTSGIGSAVSKLKGLKGASSNVDGISKAFKKGLSSIKLFVGGLLSVQGAYRAISKASQAYLSFDTELQDSFTNSWNTLGSLLAPVLELVASLFSKLTSYVASFVQVLSGVDLVAKANAKALKSQAKATKEASSASKSLGSIDEITNIASSSGSSSSSDTPQITTEDVDTSMFDGLISVIDTIKEHLQTLFEPIQTSWNTYGEGLISSIKTAFSNIIGLCGQMYMSFEEVWTNGSGQAFVDNILIGLTTIFDTIGHIAEAWSLAWGEDNAGTSFIQSIMDATLGLQEFIIEIIASIDEVIANGTLQTTISLILSICTSIFTTIGNIASAFTNAWTNANAGTGIIQNIADIFNTILGFGQSIIDTISKWVVSEEFQSALNFCFEMIEDICGAIEVVADWVLDMWNKYVKPILDEKIMPLLGDLTDAVKAIWEAAKPVIEKIWSWVKQYIEPIISGVTTAISGVIDILRGVLQFITGVFTGDWKKAWNGIKTIFSGVWDALKGIVSTVFNAIWGVIKGVLNTIISGFEKLINVVIKGLNALLKPLRDLGNGILDLIGVDIEIPKISEVSLPRLATGNVAKEPTLAIFGEYANAKSNPEITSPVSTLKEAFRDVLNEFEFNNTSGVEHLTLNVGANTLFDDFIDYINNKSSSLGVNVIKDVE